MPTILDVGIARVTWVLSTQVYTDGIDGSHWNQSTGREMNFHIVKDNGFDFVIWKITESDWFFDETFYPAFGKQRMQVLYSYRTTSIELTRMDLIRLNGCCVKLRIILKLLTENRFCGMT
jgi:hypothetical protein